MSIGEDIRILIQGGNKNAMNGTLKHMMTNKVTISLYMFSALMKDIIVSNLNGTMIITIKKSSRGMIDPHIMK